MTSNLKLALAFSVLFQTSLSIPIKRAAPAGQLFISDTGVGHRSSLAPIWQTSLRSISTSGSSAQTLRKFGEPGPGPQPVGSSFIALGPDTQHLYISTGPGIVRTDLDGSNNVTIRPESGTALTISGDKIYYGVDYDGLIKRANLDGSDAEVFLNVSNGIKYGITPTFTPAFNYPASIAIDEENEYIYWTASTWTVDLQNAGTIRRAPLISQGNKSAENVEILVRHMYMPRQVRLLDDYIYWIEGGQSQAIKRARIPATDSSPSLLPSSIQAQKDLEAETIVDSNQSQIFFEMDYYGHNMTMQITSFTWDVSSDKLWFAIESDVRTMFGKIVETSLDGGELKVLNSNVTEVGIPVGLEYVE